MVEWSMQKSKYDDERSQGQGHSRSLNYSRVSEKQVIQVMVNILLCNNFCLMSGVSKI